MIKVLTNKLSNDESFECNSIMLTSLTGQRLIITVNEDGEFNIKVE